MPVKSKRNANCKKARTESAMNYIGCEVTTNIKGNENTINNIGHEETNKQTKELLMPEKIKLL